MNEVLTYEYLRFFAPLSERTKHYEKIIGWLWNQHKQNLMSQQ